MEKATEENAAPIASQETPPAPIDDAEARIAQLETEKENYRKAYLKASKGKDPEGTESDEDKMKRIAEEAVANSRLADISREQDAIIKSALKENRELKLASMNKTTPPANMGSHSESQPVRDTLVTPDQMAEFKRRGWSDKDIERYKKNLQRNR